MMKCISSMDMNSETNYFLTLRNKLWYLLLDKKFYDYNDNLSLVKSFITNFIIAIDFFHFILITQTQSDGIIKHKIFI